MRLSLKHAKTGQKWAITAEPTDSMDTLKAIIISITEIQDFNLKIGFPPKTLIAAETIKESGIRDGEQILIVEESTVKSLGVNKSLVENPKNLEKEELIKDGIIRMREMKDDNSCLFRSIAYLLERNVDLHLQLRKSIANHILNHPLEWTTVVLGKDPKEYCDWICKSNSWGGAIELSIFSEIYKIEIDSIDISTLRVDRFGQDKWDSRVIVLYSGIHYDAIAQSPSMDSPCDFDITSFPIREELYLQEALKLAQKLQAAHKYTDLANFTLKCGICRMGFKGQCEAQNHAMSTGHVEFTEYN